MLTEKEFIAAHALYYRPLCAFAYQYLKDIEKCRDFVSDVFLKLWEEKDKYQPITVKVFLYRSLKNKCINECRHIKVVHKTEDRLIYETLNGDDEQYAQMQLIKSEMLSLIYQAIEELSPKRKEVILLWLQSNGNKIRGLDLAEKLKVSPLTIKEHKLQAYKFIRFFVNLRWKRL